MALIGWYPLNGDILDHSNGGNDLHKYGNNSDHTFVNIPGELGKVLNINGAQLETNCLKDKHDCTISFLLNVQREKLTEDWKRVILVGDNHSNLRFEVCRDSSVTFAVSNNTDYYIQDENLAAISDKSVYYDHWVRWTYTRSADKIYFYINETLISSCDSTSNNFSPGNLIIYMSWAYIKDLYIYDECLSQAEIIKKFSLKYGNMQGIRFLDNQVQSPFPIKNKDKIVYGNEFGKISANSIKYTSGGNPAIPAEYCRKFFKPDAFTETFWLYVPELKENTSFLISGENSNRMYSIFLYPNNNDLHLSWRASSATNIIGYVFSEFFDIGKWTHCTITFTGTKVSIYKNGVLNKEIGTISYDEDFFNGTLLNQDYPFFLNSNSTKGVYIQDLTLYNYVLSMEEIKDSARGLVAEWLFPATNYGNINKAEQVIVGSLTANNICYYWGTVNFTRFWGRTEDLNIHVECDISWKDIEKSTDSSVSPVCYLQGDVSGGWNHSNYIVSTLYKSLNAEGLNNIINKRHWITTSFSKWSNSVY